MTQTEPPAASATTKRGAATTATLIALPVAVVAWLGMFWWSGGFASDAKPTPSPSAVASGPVAVGLPGTADQRTETLCRALLAALPKTLVGQAGRPVTPASAVERAAAWGAPAIVLRCGVGAPATSSGTGQILEFNGVTWLVRDGADHAQIVQAVGRAVAVELDVPSAYAGRPASLLGPLAAPITSSVPTAR